MRSLLALVGANYRMPLAQAYLAWAPFVGVVRMMIRDKSGLYGVNDHKSRTEPRDGSRRRIESRKGQMRGSSEEILQHNSY